MSWITEAELKVFNNLFDKCESHFKGRDWESLAVDSCETFSRKMRVLLSERGYTIADLNAKDLMDTAIRSKLKLNPKIHQLRMIRNDLIHNGYKLDKLDESIIKVTYLYLRPFFKKKWSTPSLFKTKSLGGKL